MSRYIVTSGSKFEPFTYDEMVKPLQQMQEAENAAQDVYDTFSAEASALGEYITDNPGDERAKRMYNDYMTKLQTLQDNLYRNGYNAGTRKDLSDARASFGNISRIANAVKARQERSKSYWDFKHQHPDMVMGNDPGQSGLDNYLKDDLYGQNWYQYSGDVFAKEVADDAKNRAKELLSNPEVIKNPDLVGYLQVKERNGYTSEEVANAQRNVDAILAGENMDMEKMPLAEKILTEVLMSHLDSTGARGQVSPEEFNRLVEYGKSGLSSAVGDPTITNLPDKVWDYNKQLALANIKAGGKNGNGGKKEEVPTIGWEQNEGFVRLKNAAEGKVTKALHKEYADAYDGPQVLTLPDGRTLPVNNAEETTKYVEHNPFRDAGINAFDGIDVADRKEQVSDSGLYKYKGGKIYAKSGVDWIEDPQATQRAQQLKDYHDQYIQSVKDLNPWMGRVKKYVTTPEEERKLREKYNIPSSVPYDDLQTAVKRSKVRDEQILAPQIVGTSEEYDDLRKRYAAAIDGYAGSFESGEQLGQASQAAFYPVMQGGYDIAQKGETDLSKVFALDNLGRIVPSSISKIYVLPEDINGNDSKVRIQTIRNEKSKKGVKRVARTWVTSAFALGQEFASKLNDPQFVEEMQYLSAPLVYPVDILSKEDQSSAAWALAAAQGYIPYQMSSLGFPTAKDIIRNDNLWEMYRAVVNKRLSDQLTVPVDYETFNARRHPGYSSEKAKPHYPVGQ